MLVLNVVAGLTAWFRRGTIAVPLAVGRHETPWIAVFILAAALWTLDQWRARSALPREVVYSGWWTLAPTIGVLMLFATPALTASMAGAQTVRRLATMDTLERDLLALLPVQPMAGSRAFLNEDGPARIEVGTVYRSIEYSQPYLGPACASVLSASPIPRRREAIQRYGMSQCDGVEAEMARACRRRTAASPEVMMGNIAFWHNIPSAVLCLKALNAADVSPFAIIGAAWDSPLSVRQVVISTYEMEKGPYPPLHENIGTVSLMVFVVLLFACVVILSGQVGRGQGGMVLWMIGTSLFFGQWWQYSHGRMQDIGERIVMWLARGGNGAWVVLLWLVFLFSLVVFRWRSRWTDRGITFVVLLMPAAVIVLERAVPHVFEGGRGLWFPASDFLQSEIRGLSQGAEYTRLGFAWQVFGCSMVLRLAFFMTTFAILTTPLQAWAFTRYRRLPWKE